MRRARRSLLAVLATLAVACSTAHVSPPDGRTVDAAVGPDGPTIDAATDAAIDAGGCPIAAGDSPVLDGDGDLAAYPASQVLTPGVPNGAGDRVAITWDPTNLYVTVASPSFANAFKPLRQRLEGHRPHHAHAVDDARRRLLPGRPHRRPRHRRLVAPLTAAPLGIADRATSG